MWFSRRMFAKRSLLTRSSSDLHSVSTKFARHYFVLLGDFLYSYKSSSSRDDRPELCIFVGGTHIEALDSCPLPAPASALVIHVRDFLMTLAADNEVERDRWVHALRESAHDKSFEDYYETGEELGRGTYSVVLRARSLQRIARSGAPPLPTGCEVAVKIISKNDLDENERRCLRQVCV